MQDKIRAFARLLFFAIGSIYYILRYLIKATFVGHNSDRALRMRRDWFKSICWGVGVEIETFGEFPKEGGLLVCNHRSYFDPIIILSDVLALPVGKAEVKDWPIIGWGAKVSGSIFVDRKSTNGRKQARQEIKDALQTGYSVINFPEGTTHTLSHTIDFKPGMFRDAALEKFKIYPIALEYQQSKDAWVGDDTFIRHFFECFGKKKTLVRVSYGDFIVGNDQARLIMKSKKFIDSELKRIRSNWHQETLAHNGSKEMVS